MTPREWADVAEIILGLDTRLGERLLRAINAGRDAERSTDAATIRELREKLAELDALALTWAEKRGAYTANAKGVLLSLDAMSAELDSTKTKVAKQTERLKRQRLRIKQRLRVIGRGEEIDRHGQEIRGLKAAFATERDDLRAKLAAADARVATLTAALEDIARGGPKDGQRGGPMKLYQAQALARAALTQTGVETP